MTRPHARTHDDGALRLLVVDDEHDVRLLIRHLARRDGDGGIRIVGEAADGRSAVEVAATHEPDVILLDVRMPHVDGIAAIPALRRAAPAARIVMYSSSDARRAEALLAGADDWVSKADGWRELRRRLLPGR